MRRGKLIVYSGGDGREGDPRAGEADLIVAKHRNGATKTIPVAFEGHYSRFKDMAHSGGFSG